MKVFISFLACLSLAVPIANAQAGITITNTVVVASADDKINFGVDVNFLGTTIPTSTTLNAVDGNYRSNNAINWSISGGQTILSLDTDQSRNGTDNSYVESRYHTLRFTANSNEPYQLSGYYNVAHSGSSGVVNLFATLSDETAGVDRFRNVQSSDSTENVQFVVGGTGGDFTNTLSGSLTGNLIAGNVYNFTFNYVTAAYPGTDSGASALGNITLTIGTVPEPSTLLLLGIGAISLLGYRNAKS